MKKTLELRCWIMLFRLLLDMYRNQRGPWEYQVEANGLIDSLVEAKRLEESWEKL